MNPHVLGLDGLTSDDDPEDRSLDVDGEDGMFQDPIPTVVSVRPKVTEKWMDRFVVDLVECPSVSRTSAVARTFGPAVSEEHSPVVFTRGGGGCRCIPPPPPPVVVESASTPVSDLRSVESDSAHVSGLQLVESDTSRVSVLPVAGCEFLAVFLGKVAFDAVGLGVGPPFFRVDSEEALLKQTDVRALLARTAPGVTKSRMVGRQETMNDMEMMKYVPQMTASVWMPFKQTCVEESGDPDFDSFKTAPWDAGGTQRDELHEVMYRAMVHNVDRWTTRDTERELVTKMLMDTNCPRLTMTRGEDDASYRGIQIGGESHDTLAISDGHTRRKDDDILRRSAVCVEVVIPADMNCTKVELNDMTILLRRLPRRQDSAEHDECYISVSNAAAAFNDAVFRRRRLPRTEVFAESVEEKYIAPRTDSVSAEQNNLTFCRPKPPRRDVSTEQDMNCSGIKGDSTVSELCDHLCRRRSLPPNRAITGAGGSVHKHMTLVRRTNFPPKETAGVRNDDYIRLTSESNQSVCGRPVTGSLCSGQVYGLHSLDCLDSGTLLPKCNYQQTVIYIAPDYCCSDHKWYIESYTVRSSITVILIVWYCIGVFRL